MELLNYYRRCILNATHILASLGKMSKDFLQNQCPQCQIQGLAWCRPRTRNFSTSQVYRAKDMCEILIVERLRTNSPEEQKFNDISTHVWDHFPTLDGQFNGLHIPLIELPPCWGFQHCFIIVHSFTRCPETIPLSEVPSCHRCQSPYPWVDEPSNQFESTLFSDISQTPGTVLNDMVERFHCTLKTALSCLVLLSFRTTFKDNLHAYSLRRDTPSSGESFSIQNGLAALPYTFMESFSCLAQTNLRVLASKVWSFLLRQAWKFSRQNSLE